jgi:hypothetical protein
MNPARSLLRSYAAILSIAVCGILLHADSGTGFTLGASGSGSIYAELSFPEATGGSLGRPGFETRLESDLRLSAESPTALFRLRIGAYAEGDKSSGIDPADYSDAIGLEVREAEASLLPAPSLALRGGVLLRNFGAVSCGSPIDPFARATGQSGFWGLGAEWTPAPDLSALAILSADRLARSGSVSGLKDCDSGAILRFSPGAFDAAIGLYASGAGEGELRPIGYLSLPLLSTLASLEAAVSFPGGGSVGKPAGSLRCELRKSLDPGRSSLELGAAYRGIFPGRDEEGIADLLASSSPNDLACLPFAPYYGRHYAELALYIEDPNVFSLSAEAMVALPWGSLSGSAKAEVYIGDAGVFVQVQGVAGDSNGEFPAMALAAGMPGLEARAGIEISF